ncbi:MAG: bifunctional metallophosphatase/5'-nucleotidase [bacterium]|nr:bifunctional metallophosphatase/5'-nucleotidase [bacterium]
MSFKRGTILLLLIILAMGSSAALSSDAEKKDDGILRLNLLWTNDVHGHIAPEPARFMNPEFPPPLGGGPSAARYIKAVRARAEANGEEVLLVDVGDMFQGAPIGSMTEGTSVIEYFNAIGYDFAVPGNHDFDKGQENCERLARLSNFPWVCSNLASSETGELVDWCLPQLMLDVQGIKIGVIGIITPATKSMSFEENIEGLDFLNMPETISEYRDRLLSDGADLIMLGIHEGLPFNPDEGWKRIVGATETETAGDNQGTYGSNYSNNGMNLMELVHAVPGVDFAVGGHTHRGYHHPWIDPVNHTMCFESFGNGSSIGHAVLLIDRETKTLVGYEGTHDRGTLITLFEDEIWPDEEIAEVIRPHVEKTEAAMARVVGASAFPLGRGGPGANLVGNLVTDAMIDYFDADFSFQNMGGLRADMPGGDLTSGDVFAVLPFGNELVVIEMEGTMVRRVIERKLAGRSGGICIGGAKMTFDKGREDYDRIVELEIGGQPWDPSATYKVVCTNFLLEGNSGLNFLTGISSAKISPTGVITSDAVERYLEKNSPVRPKVDDRWVESPGQAQKPYLAVDYLQ